MTQPDPEVPKTPHRPLPILVFAGTPPPVHGQNVMVAALLPALAGTADLRVLHVDPRLSSASVEVGRPGAGKLFRLLRACLQVWAARLRHGPFVLYYVPAPPARTPVFRDWIAMLLCRPLASRLVLHWHAVGLGAWLHSGATAIERVLTRGALGRADLALVLAPELATDAAEFSPRRTVIAANGIVDPVLPPRAICRAIASPGRPFRGLFVGLGSEAKGLFRAAAAVAAANGRERGAFTLTFAGNFASPADAERFRALQLEHPAQFVHAGFADPAARSGLLESSDVLLFPTRYPFEGQPLVLLEALAHDLPIIATPWRAIPGMLPNDSSVQLVDSDDPQRLADALFTARAAPPPSGTLRAHFESHFTLQRHFDVVLGALRAASA